MLGKFGKLISRRGYKRNDVYVGGDRRGQRDLVITVSLGVRKDYRGRICLNIKTFCPW